MTEILQRSSAAQRWLAIAMDPEMVNRPERIETDAVGRLMMSPQPDFLHRKQALKISNLLDGHLGSEGSVQEQAIETSDGTKVADVVWLTEEQEHALNANKNLPLNQAPPICIEISSPTSSLSELEHKRELYFEAGAKEVWICDRKGQLRFFLPSGEISKSILVPPFPKQITIGRLSS
ncbi:MAG: Uma2 family endonuclease [Verrucomicrobia bacterium]|nr:Uma2 family endonuclease [Verrucomicrobiota bacterium]